MLEKLIRLRERLSAICGYIAAFLLFTMCVLVLYQVFTRYVLNDPAAFTEEIVRYMLIWTGFVGAAAAFGTRQHMALMYVVEIVKPKTKVKMMVFTDAIVLFLAVFVMLIGGVQNAVNSANAFSPLLGVPRALVYAIAPLSAVFIILIQVANIFEDLHLNDPKENAK